MSFQFGVGKVSHCPFLQAALNQTLSCQIVAIDATRSGELDFTAQADGSWTIVVSDRLKEGGKASRLSGSGTDGKSDLAKAKEAYQQVCFLSIPLTYV
jgi:hypothetical protein